MVFFVPAWYQQDSWNENEQIWYRSRKKAEFDDTVKQIQLFHRNKVQDYRILLLSFAPNFRHFLHRQSVYRAPYWSCFDAIQEVRRKKIYVFSFHNMNWPDGVEFIYSPFAVVAQLNGVRYAQIEFGEDGNPIQIDLYEDGKLHRRNIYDDRGFVSSTILYQDEQPVYQDYLMENGVWKMRFFYQDGHVEMNPKTSNFLLVKEEKEMIIPFKKLKYATMDEVIREVVEAYLKLTEERDIFCIAMHERHAEILGHALKGRRMILSFYRDRYDLANHPQVMEILHNAGYIVADSEVTMREIKQFAGTQIRRICSITPYDSRVDYGISSQLNVQKILVPVDEMEEPLFEETIKYLAQYLERNEKARVYLFTRQAEYNCKAKYLQMARIYLKKAGFDEKMALEVNDKVAENTTDDEQTTVKFFVEQCMNELAVSKCMREQRIVVDVRNTLDLYLQVLALSVGVPQIQSHRTQFVEPGKNGMIVEKLEELPEAIHYYLDGLQHWNEAMVHCREISKYHTTGMLINRWKEVIDSVG